MSTEMTRFTVPVSGKFHKKVMIPTVDGEIEATVTIQVTNVKLKAPNQHIAKEMAEAVSKRLAEDMNKK